MVEPSGSERAAPAAVTPGIVPICSEQARIEIHHLLRRGVSRLRQRDPHRQHAGRVEAEIDPLQRPQRPQHQSRADEEHDRERHLGDDQSVPEAGAPAAGRGVAASFLHRLGQIRLEQARGRRDAEDDRGHERDADGEQQHAPVDRRSGDAGNARRVPPGEEPHADPGERQAGGGADAGEHQALGQQLAHDPGRPRAERGAHRHLALARFRAREQQVGDVGAGDQQQEADRAEEQPDRAAHGADDFLAQRQHHGVELHLRGIEALARSSSPRACADRRGPAPP